MNCLRLPGFSPVCLKTGMHMALKTIHTKRIRTEKVTRFCRKTRMRNFFVRVYWSRYTRLGARKK
jgi:hypothetical protein